MRQLLGQVPRAKQPMKGEIDHDSLDGVQEVCGVWARLRDR